MSFQKRKDSSGLGTSPGIRLRVCDRRVVCHSINALVPCHEEELRTACFFHGLVHAPFRVIVTPIPS
jgi:hypothetical protein